MKLLLLKPTKKITDIIFPKYIYCICCKKITLDSKNGICNSCTEKIIWAEENNTCSKCGRILSKKFAQKFDWSKYLCKDCIEKAYKFDRVISVLKYNDLTMQIPLGLKSLNEFDSFEIMALFMRKRIKETKLHKKINYVTYVPMSKLKQKGRGFNHSYELANKISLAFSFPLIDGLFGKKNKNPDTKSLSEDARYSNLKKSFEINRNTDIKNIKDKNFLIVDDVFTTGYTISILAGLLKEIGAKEVYGLTFTTRSCKEYSLSSTTSLV